MNPQPKSQLLIVDDYPTNIKVLSDLLIDHGFEVLIARDGENALQKLQRITPDLILLDVLMPGMDGFETCRRLKEQPSTCDIPVIFMTALADPVDKVKGLTLGAVDYITKPFQQEEVLARVSTHLRLRHLSRQLADQNAQLQAEARSRQLAENALRASEEKFVKAFRANPGPIMIATLEEGRLVEANQTFCQTLGYPIETILNHRLQELSLFQRSDDCDRLLTILRDQKAIHHFECELRTLTGDIRVCLISAEVIIVRDSPCILAMMIDITDCKQAAIAMEQAKAAAELASQAKTRFLSNISHELRTPLNTILGYTHLLERDTTLSTEQQTYLETINRSSRHLLTLINDVLEMTKIEAGQLVLNPSVCDLPNLLQTLTAMLEPKVLAKDLHLTLDLATDVPPYIHVDETKLRQILLNLLSNGIKFTDQGQVSLQIRKLGDLPDEDQSVMLQFAIADTGSGIADTELDSLFDPFVQTEAGRRTQEGTGLGLPISQQFVNLMGGQITVESTVGVGSVFRFNLPVDVATAQDKPSSKLLQQRRVVGLATDHPPCRILIVEDQPANRDLLVRLLNLVGFAVQTATNGREAIAQYLHWQPHLILMDIRMPLLDGYEATREIRTLAQQQPSLADPQPASINPAEGPLPKIIALTANAFEEERQAAYAAGCDGFIRKPIQEAELFASIAEHLGVGYLYADEGETPNPTATAEETASQGLPETVVADLVELVGGDTLFLVEYIQTHIEQMPLLLQELKSAIAQQDAPTACRSAHTLKSMGLTFSAQPFADLCLSMEQQAAEGSTSIAPDQLQAIETHLGELLLMLQQTVSRFSRDGSH